MSDATRQCRVCDVIKPLEDFKPQGTSTGGRRWDCRACQAVRSRRYLLRKRFGISVEEYDAMLEAQGGRCAICESDETRSKWVTFAVDHCHDTGRVRGLLCGQCNYALGKLGDTPQNLLRAYRYVAGLNLSDGSPLETPVGSEVRPPPGVAELLVGWRSTA